MLLAQNINACYSRVVASTWSDILYFRAKVFQHLRSYFFARDFLEIDTPVLVACPGAEAYLQYFSSQWLDSKGDTHDLYLRSSPELHMKQAMGFGLTKIFQIAKCFRNGGEYSRWHHPEFMMLEWYQAETSFEQFIEFTTDLLAELFQEHGKAPLGTWHKITVKEAFANFAAINLQDGDPDLAAKAQAKGVLSVHQHDDFATAYFKILLDVIEPQLQKLGSVVLYDYPLSQSALAHREESVAKRFEVYLSGVEICNAFLECVSSVKNLQRFAEISSLRAQANLPAVPPDEYFFSALKTGIKPCCGNALGLERLLALLYGAKNLDEVILFRQQLTPANRHTTGEETF